MNRDKIVEVMARAGYGSPGAPYDDAEPWVREASIELAEAALSALDAAGYAVVSATPTEAMLVAAQDWSRDVYGKPIGNAAAIGCWAAMLKAAQETRDE